MKILVDADALPREIEDVLVRASERVSCPLVFVSNRSRWRASSPLVSSVVVAGNFDAADDRIVALAEHGDLVVTADIPLADRVLARGASAMDQRGGTFTAENVKEKLATRALLEDLRAGGEVGGGPAPFGRKDVQAFANALDRWLTRARRAGC